MWNFMTLASLCGWADQFESYLVENPEDRFSHDEAHMVSDQLITVIKVSQQQAPKCLRSSIVQEQGIIGCTSLGYVFIFFPLLY